MSDGTDVLRPWQDVPVVAGVATVAAALLVGPVVGGLVTGPWPVVAAIAIALATEVAGRALTPRLGLPASTPRWLVAVVVGYATVSAVHLGATALLDLGVSAASAIDVAVLGVLAAVGRWWWRPSTVPDAPSARSWRLQVAALLACAVLSAVWARETIRAVPHAQETGVFPAWQDYFLHAAEISYLRDYPAYDGRSQYLTAIPQPLYHRGSFALGAVFSWLGDVPSLGVATAYWMPAGLLLTMCATVAWGAALGGPLAGLGALAAVFLVPDASHYGAENHFLSFEWLMQMASGSGYALPLVLTALTVLGTAGLQRWRGFVVATLLVAATALFRVHVALLAGATLAWLFVFTWRPRLSWRRVATALLLAAAGAGVLLWMESVPLAPHFLTGRREPALFFLSVHSQANEMPTVFRAWWDTHGVAADVAVGFPLMLWAGLGLWLVAVPLLGIAGSLAPLGAGAAWLPLALVAADLAIILLLPVPAHGDPTDWGHRPFVLVYLAFAALTGMALGRALATRAARATAGERGALVAAAVAFALALVVPWQLSARVQQRWVPQYATMIVPLDAWPAAAYVRAHAGAADQILAASEDHYALFVALSERRAWLSRASLYRQLGSESSSAVAQRLDAHAALGPAPTWEQLRAFGREQGVAWYFADAPSSRQWLDDVVDRCVYCGDTVRVYDLR